MSDAISAAASAADALLDGVPGARRPELMAALEELLIVLRERPRPEAGSS
jgi:hypothetical protein